MFLLLLSEIRMLLRKVQIRKALGNERVAGAHYTPAWRGATECGLRGWPCGASQISLEPGQAWLPLSLLQPEGRSCWPGCSAEPSQCLWACGGGRESRESLGAARFNAFQGGGMLLRLCPEEGEQQAKMDSGPPASSSVPTSPALPHCPGGRTSQEAASFRTNTANVVQVFGERLL